MPTQKVKSNIGSGGVDRMSLEQFAPNYRDHLYKIGNRDEFGQLHTATD